MTTEVTGRPLPQEAAFLQGPGQHTTLRLATWRVLFLQVVEISSLTEHLLTECDQKDGFGRCYRCSEAVSKEELPRHVKTRDCNRECPRTSRPQTVSSPGAQLQGWGSGPTSASATGALSTTHRSNQKSLSHSNSFSRQIREVGKPVSSVP